MHIGATYNLTTSTKEKKKTSMAVDASLRNIVPHDDSSKALVRAVRRRMMMAHCMVLGCVGDGSQD